MASIAVNFGTSIPHTKDGVLRYNSQSHIARHRCIRSATLIQDDPTTLSVRAFVCDGDFKAQKFENSVMFLDCLAVHAVIAAAVVCPTSLRLVRYSLGQHAQPAGSQLQGIHLKPIQVGPQTTCNSMQLRSCRFQWFIYNPRARR
jgi:hypothetical protein